MKKSILLMLLTVIVGLTGCGSKSSDAEKVSVITREDGSGTRGAFVELVGILENGVDNTSVDAIVHDGTGKVMTAVQNDENAIGYISLGSLNDTVKAVAIGGVAPTIDNIKSGEYKIARPFNITTGEKKSALTEDFLAFIQSADVQKIVNKNGFISIYKDKNFTSNLEEGTIVIGGSTSVYPLMEKIAEAYKLINPNALINIEAIGSSAGIKGSVDGKFDIGMASRELKEKEKKLVKYMPIAMDGIAIIVNKQNPLASITKEQIKGIYEDTITSFAAIK